MMTIFIIMGPIPTRGKGGLNRGGRIKRLDIGGLGGGVGGRMERTHPRRGGCNYMLT